MSWARIGTRPWLAFLLGVFLVALGARLYRIGTLSAWEDETKEAMDVVESVEHDGLASGALVRHVQRFGQPPLSYYFQQVVIANAGLTVAGIRMHSAILGAVMCVVVALLWLRMRPPGSRTWPWTFGLLAIPVFAPQMVYYGQEARPYSTALLLSAVYLLVLHEFLFRGGGRVRVGELLVLTATQVAFLLSVAFQPAVILFTACLAMVPLTLCATMRRRVLWTWATALAAFMAFLPWQTIPLERYRREIKGDVSAGIEGIPGQLLEAPLVPPTREWMEAFYRDAVGLGISGPGLVWLGVLALAASGLLLARLTRARGRRLATWGLFLMLFCLALPYTYTGVREALIDYPDHPRYSIAAAPFVFVLFILLGAMATESVGRLPASRSGPLSRRRVAPAVAGVVVSMTVVGLSVDAMARSAYRHRGWLKKMHKVLAAASEEGDLYYSPDYRLRGAFHFYSIGHLGRVGSMEDLVHDLATGRMTAGTRRVFISNYTVPRFRRSDLSRLAREHESVQVVFDRHPLRCVVVLAGPEGMLATLGQIFQEWESWVRKRYPRGDGPAYVSEGMRVLRGIPPGAVAVEGDEARESVAR